MSRKRKPGKRRNKRVVVTLTPRQLKDPYEALEAVREALRKDCRELCVRIREEELQDESEVAVHIAREQLEAAALRMAANHLDQKAECLSHRKQTASPVDERTARSKLRGVIESLVRNGFGVYYIIEFIGNAIRKYGS